MATVTKTGERRADAGAWKDRLDTISIGGTTYLRRTQVASFKRKNGTVAATTATINVFDRKTLAPISRLFRQHVMSTGQDVVDKITFTRNAVTVASTANGKTVVRKSGSNRPAFDFYGGLYAVGW